MTVNSICLRRISGHRECNFVHSPLPHACPLFSKHRKHSVLILTDRCGAQPSELKPLGGRNPSWIKCRKSYEFRQLSCLDVHSSHHHLPVDQFIWVVDSSDDFKLFTNNVRDSRSGDSLGGMCEQAWRVKSASHLPQAD